MRTQNAEIKHREQLRRKYFEDPEYNRWSDILNRQLYEGFADSNYGGRRDELVILSYILNRPVLMTSTLTLEELLAHKDDPKVN